VTWTYTYDTAANHYNLLTSMMTPPIGNPPAPRTWTYGLDPTGKTVTSITDPLTHQTTMTYNSFGQPTQITDALSHATFFDYDATTGFLTGVRDHSRELVTDPRGAKTRFTYDQLNRVTAIADPLGGAVRFQYDANSNLTKVIDPRGGEIAYTYDSMDRVQTRTDPLGRQETFGYDLAGNVTSFVDRKNQQTIWSSYDDLNRPTTVTFQGGTTLTYGYDAANRLQSLTDSIAGAITWGFDALDRMTSETTPQGTVTYGLDDADRRMTMTVAGQPQVSYTWDNGNRLTDIIRGSLAAHYVYDNANRRTSLQLPNAVTIAYGYDAANRLTSLIYSYGATELGRLTYQYDPAGNRTVMGGSWARTLLPAAISTASYDAANRQLTLGGKTMVYDNNGNLATLTESGQTTAYTWDVRDRLSNISGPGLTASFAYDGKSRRTQKTITGFTSTFQYDGADIVREVAGGSGVNYLRGLGMDEHLARIEDGGNTTCYAPDALGSTLALTDTGGAVATEYTYEPFGRTTVTGATSQNAFQYTGRENDGTGLYYYRARYYSPMLHRFASEDPILAPVSFLTGCAGLSRGSSPSFVSSIASGPSPLIDAGVLTSPYLYVANNPATFVDPLGLEKQASLCMDYYACMGLCLFFSLRTVPGCIAKVCPFVKYLALAVVTAKVVAIIGAVCVVGCLVGIPVAAYYGCDASCRRIDCLR
jgi:RHS repeat-associated protein